MTTPVEHRLYLSSDQIDELFAHLRGRLRQTHCDDTLKETMAWAESTGIPSQALRSGLARLGARCDCQVVFTIWRLAPDTSLPYGMLI